MSFVAHDVSVRAGETPLVREASLRVDTGQVHALLGPNGAGKSTLLRCLAGELVPHAGRIELNGRPLAAWSPRQQARQRAVLPQQHALSFGFTAAQVVALGRLAALQQRPEREAAIVAEALAAAGVAALAVRKYPTLSGGERARVQLARVMAQVWEPADAAARFLLLDEPTASLDLAHQHDCLVAVRRFAAGGVGALVILHDPNLALRYADTVTLMKDGRVVASGAPAQAITAGTLQETYGVRARFVMVDGETVVVPAPR